MEFGDIYEWRPIRKEAAGGGKGPIVHEPCRAQGCPMRQTPHTVSDHPKEWGPPLCSSCGGSGRDGAEYVDGFWEHGGTRQSQCQDCGQWYGWSQRTQFDLPDSHTIGDCPVSTLRWIRGKLQRGEEITDRDHEVMNSAIAQAESRTNN